MMGFYSNQTFDKTWFIDDKTWRCNSSNVGIQPNEKKTSSNTKDLEKFGLVKHIWHILMFLVGWTSRSISYVLMWTNHGTLRMGSPDIWRGEKMLPGLGVADDSARQFRKRWSNTTLGPVSYIKHGVIYIDSWSIGSALRIRCPGIDNTSRNWRPRWGATAQKMVGDLTRAIVKSQNMLFFSIKEMAILRLVELIWWWDDHPPCTCFDHGTHDAVFWSIRMTKHWNWSRDAGQSSNSEICQFILWWDSLMGWWF